MSRRGNRGGKRGRGTRGGRGGRGRGRGRGGDSSNPPRNNNNNNNNFEKMEDEFPLLSSEASAEAMLVDFELMSPEDLKQNKVKLLNTVSAALINEPKMSLLNPTFVKITKLAKKISFYDPEFILKLALYVRHDLNIRSTANYLIALACNITESQLYVRKYYGKVIALPSDWLDSAATYQSLPDKLLKGKALPTCLRKSMVDRFPEFDVYQLGKYNKERSIKRKQKKDETIWI